MADPPPVERVASSRQRSSRSNNAASLALADRTTQTYGYHNTFHTHEQPLLTTAPPTYASASSPQTLRFLNEKAHAEKAPCPLPPYECTVEIAGPLGLKQELSTPFQVASSRDWNDVHVVLQGTQLSIHRLKSPGLLSKSRAPRCGRLIKAYSLQHAEIGVAADFKKAPLTPKSPFAHLVPVSARAKLFETDPHLFEPAREFVIRLRLETEQFLLCAPSQEGMLDWVEKLCAALDISPPLEDRCEPRYRSLPRRTRRQRVFDGVRVSNPDGESNLDAGRAIIAEQERIIRRLYPHLAASLPSAAPESNLPTSTVHPALDLETDDLDPEDVRFPSVSRTESHGSESEERPSSSATTDSSADPKLRTPSSHSWAQAMRYRRRCAPILLAHSPRVSDVVFSRGKRLRINARDHLLINYTSHPPRYDGHNFPKKNAPLPRIAESVATKPGPAPITTGRPYSPVRHISDESFMSFGYDLASTSSRQPPSDESDGFRSALSSGPPSPALAIQAKADATRRLVIMGKTRTSDERARDDGLSPVALGVGLLI